MLLGDKQGQKSLTNKSGAQYYLEKGNKSGLQIRELKSFFRFLKVFPQTHVLKAGALAAKAGEVWDLMSNKQKSEFRQPLKERIGFKVFAREMNFYYKHQEKTLPKEERLTQIRRRWLNVSKPTKLYYCSDGKQIFKVTKD